jgi:hypothetical protein
MNEQEFKAKLEEVAGDEFSMRIENNEMIITPAEAGVALLAAISQLNSQEDEAWQELDRLAGIIEELREDNANLRDVLETLHPMMVEFGQDEIADRLMRIAYPVAGVMDDGTVVKFEDPQ